MKNLFDVIINALYLYFTWIPDQIVAAYDLGPAAHGIVSLVYTIIAVLAGLGFISYLNFGTQKSNTKLQPKLPKSKALALVFWIFIALYFVVVYKDQPAQAITDIGNAANSAATFVKGIRINPNKIEIPEVVFTPIEPDGTGEAEIRSTIPELPRVPLTFVREPNEQGNMAVFAVYLGHDEFVHQEINGTEPLFLEYMGLEVNRALKTLSDNNIEYDEQTLNVAWDLQELWGYSEAIAPKTKTYDRLVQLVGTQRQNACLAVILDGKVAPLVNLPTDNTELDMRIRCYGTLQRRLDHQVKFLVSSAALTNGERNRQLDEAFSQKGMILADLETLKDWAEDHELNTQEIVELMPSEDELDAPVETELQEIKEQLAPKQPTWFTANLKGFLLWTGGILIALALLVTIGSAARMALRI